MALKLPPGGSISELRIVFTQVVCLNSEGHCGCNPMQTFLAVKSSG